MAETVRKLDAKNNKLVMY